MIIGCIDDRYIELQVLAGTLEKQGHEARTWQHITAMREADLSELDYCLIDYYLDLHLEDGLLTREAIELCKESNVPCAIRTGAKGDDHISELGRKLGIPVTHKNYGIPIIGHGENGTSTITGWLNEEGK